MSSVQQTIREIYEGEKPEAFEKLGITAIENASIHFIDPHTIEVNGKTMRAGKFLIATGSSPLVPPVPGLSSVPYYTNETIFTLATLPASLTIMGGGPIGIELAQAMWHITNQKQGVSALGLQRVLGFGSYRTSWIWLHKLRCAMVRPGRDRLGGAVEVEETYIGGSKPGKRGRGAAGKVLVLVAAQEDENRIGRIRLRRVADASAISLEEAVQEMVVPGSIVRTDDWLGYRGLVRHGYIHDVVRKDASIGENLLPTGQSRHCFAETLAAGNSPKGLYKYLILITTWMNTPSDLIAEPQGHEENSSIAWFNKPFPLSRLRAIRSLAECNTTYSMYESEVHSPIAIILSRKILAGLRCGVSRKIGWLGLSARHDGPREVLWPIACPRAGKCSEIPSILTLPIYPWILTGPGPLPRARAKRRPTPCSWPGMTGAPTIAPQVTCCSDDKPAWLVYAESLWRRSGDRYQP